MSASGSVYTKRTLERIPRRLRNGGDAYAVSRRLRLRAAAAVDAGCSHPSTPVSVPHPPGHPGRRLRAKGSPLQNLSVSKRFLVRFYIRNYG